MPQLEIFGLKDKWRRMTYRKRCTAFALFGVGATPVVALHGYRALRSYADQGGYVAVAAWIGLISIYYVIVRAWLDLVTDAVDYARKDYTLLGGDINKPDQRSLKTFPFDMITASDAKRNWSAWQYLLSFWTYIENTLISNVVLVAILMGITQSPYFDAGKGVYSHYYVEHRYIVWLLTSFFFMSTSVLTFAATWSMIIRNRAGVMSIPLRWLGLHNFYPGQNVFPRWLNELLVKVIGRSM